MFSRWQVLPPVMSSRWQVLLPTLGWFYPRHFPTGLWRRSGIASLLRWELLSDNISLIRQLDAIQGYTLCHTVGPARPWLHEVSSLPMWCYCFLGIWPYLQPTPRWRICWYMARLATPAWYLWGSYLFHKVQLHLLVVPISSSCYSVLQEPCSPALKAAYYFLCHGRTQVSSEHSQEEWGEEEKTEESSTEADLHGRFLLPMSYSVITNISLQWRNCIKDCLSVLSIT